MVDAQNIGVIGGGNLAVVSLDALIHWIEVNGQWLTEQQKETIHNTLLGIERSPESGEIINTGLAIVDLNKK